jgi:hypothetical protein
VHGFGTAGSCRSRRFPLVLYNGYEIHQVCSFRGGRASHFVQSRCAIHRFEYYPRSRRTDEAETIQYCTSQDPDTECRLVAAKQSFFVFQEPCRRVSHSRSPVGAIRSLPRIPQETEFAQVVS